MPCLLTQVKQLTRIELHTEGLSESTDELWYRHATNDFLDFRKQSPAYDHSGEWRSKYEVWYGTDSILEGDL